MHAQYICILKKEQLTIPKHSTHQVSEKDLVGCVRACHIQKDCLQYSFIIVYVTICPQRAPCPSWRSSPARRAPWTSTTVSTPPWGGIWAVRGGLRTSSWTWPTGTRWRNKGDQTERFPCGWGAKVVWCISLSWSNPLSHLADELFNYCNYI